MNWKRRALGLLDAISRHRAATPECFPHGRDEALYAALDALVDA